MKLLLLEDDPILADLLCDFLNESYSVTHCYNSQEMQKALTKSTYDFYLFDINVPGTSGTELLKELRQQKDRTPAIIITAYQESKILEEAFAKGANDFIKKPFDLLELKVRIENLRKQFHLDTIITIDNKQFFPELHLLKEAQHSQELPTKESQLLAYLYTNKTRVINSDEIANTLWAYPNLPSDENIRTLIKNLRSKIGKEHIINIRGLGYRYE
jgi:two-component system, OmpR family, response regulator